MCKIQKRLTYKKWSALQYKEILVNLFGFELKDAPYPIADLPVPEVFTIIDFNGADDPIDQ